MTTIYSLWWELLCFLRLRPRRIYLFIVMDLKTEKRRCWGWYHSFKDAERAALTNEGDAYEAGTFDAALIECVEEYIMPDCEKRWFYSAVHEPISDMYVVKPIPCPDKFKDVVCFVIG